MVGPEQTTLEVSGLTVSAGSKKLLSDVAMSLRPGELVSLVGPNGAGKSTLLRTIVGVTRADSGQMLLSGQPLGQLGHKARAQRLAYLPQERLVSWNLCVADVVALGRFPHDDGRRWRGNVKDDPLVLAALERVGARELARRRFGVLSGGEKALVLLARTLAVDAPLMLIDEPIAGLDPYHQLQVMEVLRESASAGRGILMVLHDLTLAARFSDRLILLHQGRVRASGPASAVLNDESLSSVFHIDVRHLNVDGRDLPLPWSRQTPP